MPWQRLNHYPKSTAITKKDSLARNMKRMKGVHGATVYNFNPMAFNLPNDYTKFLAEFSRLRDKNPDKPQYWICKPADMSRGRGIFVFKDINELQYDCNAVVQTYIANPLLISGYKFDLRIYVLVPSFHPLKIYIFQEGLVRFSTEKFDLGSLKNVYSHLTNTSINKYGPSYLMDKERVGPGCKWTLTQLRHYFRQININDSQLFIKIQYIVILTVLIQANQVPKVSNCFELYGFDILIDENMKPWLLEVNFSPAFAADCQADMLVKRPLLSDLLDLLDFSEEDKERGGAEYKKFAAEQLQVYTSYIPPPGGRRSSLGNAPNKRPGNGGALKKKASQSRLVDLNNNNGQAGSTHSLSGATPRSTCTSQHDTDTAAEEQSTYFSPRTASPEQKVIPLVPGCGLPSVQQPTVQRAPKVYKSRTLQESGRSSCSGSDTEDEHYRLNHTKPSDVAKSLNAYERSLLAGSTRASKSVYSKQYNKLPSKNRYLPPGGLSKLSLGSDSGFSSTSGSNSSDYVDQRQAANEDSVGLTLKQKQLLDISASPKNIKSLSQPQSLQRDLDEEVPYYLDKSNSPNHFSKSSLPPSGKDLAKSQSQTQLNNTRATRTSQLRSANSLQQRIQNSFTLRRHEGKLSDIWYSHSLPANRLKGRKDYDKPWRRKSSSELEAQGGTTTSKRLPSRSGVPEKVGDYFLVFPFNDVTRQQAKTNLDPRVVIKETQRLVKDRLAASIDKTSAAIFKKGDIHDDVGLKGNLSARSGQRSLPITLASEKSMLSSVTDPGQLSPTLGAKNKTKRNSHQRDRDFSGLWAPISLDTSAEHGSFQY